MHFLIKKLRKSESCRDTVTMVLVTESLWMTEGLNEQRERRINKKERTNKKERLFRIANTNYGHFPRCYCSQQTTTSVQLLTEGRKRR